MLDLVLLTVMLVLSGFFSGSETALVSLSSARAEALAQEGRRGARALWQLKQDPSRMLIIILIGNNIVNISASAMATLVASEYFGNLGPGIAVGVLTILILVFGEITPKSMATQYAERISLLVATPLVWLGYLLYPLVWFFSLFTRALHSRSGSAADPTVTESELINLLGAGQREGVLDDSSHEILRRVFDYRSLVVEDIMTPRQRVITLSGAMTVADALPELLRGEYSRIPVYGDEAHQIVRVLHLRDFLDAIASGARDSVLGEMGSEPFYVPDNQPATKVLALMKEKQRPMAIVVDEHGEMQGIVTFEDFTEELVGEIFDESDSAMTGMHRMSRSELLANGDLELRAVEENLGIELPGKPTDTVSWWILEHTGRIPGVGETFHIDKLRVEIQRADDRKIIQVSLQQSDADA